MAPAQLQRGRYGRYACVPDQWDPKGEVQPVKLAHPSFQVVYNSAREQLNSSTWRTACVTLINTVLADQWQGQTKSHASLSRLRATADMNKEVFLTGGRIHSGLSLLFLLTVRPQHAPVSNIDLSLYIYLFPPPPPHPPWTG